MGTVVRESHLKLIREFPLRRIKTAAEHARVKAIALRLSSLSMDRGTAEHLDVLVDLIADYEKRSELTVDASNVSAADLVRHRIMERGISVRALARLIDVPQSNLSEMLVGKRDWSKNAIRGLCNQLNIRAERFLN